MLGFAGIITMTLLLIVGFGGILSGASIHEVKSNWAKHRCNVFAMFAAPLFKPKENTQSSFDFAKDNFKFCVNENAKQAAQKAFAPLYAVFGQLMQISDFVMKLMTTFRTYLNNSVTGFSKILYERFYKFIGIFDKFRLGYIKLTHAYDKINAMIVASLYQGISGVIFLTNMQNYVIKVVKIIMAILIVMMIFAFFILLPFIPVIIVPTIGALAAVGISIDGAGAFCLHPKTNIVMEDGSSKTIDTINLEDSLLNIRTNTITNTTTTTSSNTTTNIVTGILVAEGYTTPLYKYKDILLSGTHRVFINNKWVMAKDISSAIQTTTISDRLYILNTTQHSVPVKTNINNEIVSVGDWEEVSELSGQNAWLNFVEKTLNTKINQNTKIKHVHYKPTTIPLLGIDTCVYTPNGQKVPIHSVKIGDYILDQSSTPTRVIGTYKAKLPLLVHTTEYLTDGVWILQGDTWVLNKEGVQEVHDYEVPNKFACNLITLSGTIRIECNSTNYIVRDFTECGIDNIEGCYEVLDKVL